MLPLIAITYMLLIGCASALDATRDGEAVSAVSIRQLLDDPETWDRKWVRLEGWFDTEVCVFPKVQCIVDSHDWWADPRDHAVGRIGVAFDGFTPGAHNRTKVIVSGRVDSSCYAALQRQVRMIKQAADPPSVTTVHPSLSCELIPVLEHVIMQAAEAQQ